LRLAQSMRDTPVRILMVEKPRRLCNNGGLDKAWPTPDDG
jgi:hypothetical protein